MNETYESTDLSRVRRNRWILGLAASPVLVALAAVVAGLGSNSRFFLGTIHPLVFAITFTLLAWGSNPWPSYERTPVKANRGGIRIGKRFFPRHAIRDGFIVPARAGKPVRVVLRRHARPAVELSVPSAAEGRRVLHALGLDASQTVASFRAMSKVFAKGPIVPAMAGIFAGLYVATAASARHNKAGFPVFLFSIALLAFLALVIVPTRIDVGVDGIVTSWFWRERFISYREILAVEVYTDGWGKNRYTGLTLVLNSGESIRLPVASKRTGEDRVATLEERIREAMESYRAGGAESAAALLRRKGRRTSQWLTELRALGAGANVDLRTAPLPREHLFRIVEDPALDGGARAAAAVALSAELRDDERERLRAAAGATVAPKLRIAFEKASESTGTGADPALEEALAEVEADEASRAEAS